MREICTSGSMRGEAATMVTLVPPLLLYWLDFSVASLRKCYFSLSRMPTVAVQPNLVHPSSRISIALSSVRTPPAALI